MRRYASVPDDVIQALATRFALLWRRCAGDRQAHGAADVWASVCRHYGAPERRYHDLRHLARCFAEFEAARGLMTNPDQVDLALWFHDIVHSAGRGDNEARSAELFRSAAAGVLYPAFVDDVCAMILLTTHRDTPVDPDQQFVCDIDLSSLGAPWAVYLEDSANLRDEDARSSAQYYPAQRTFLVQMLARPRIYFTDFFHARFETRARANMQRYIELIDSGQL